LIFLVPRLYFCFLYQTTIMKNIIACMLFLCLLTSNISAQEQFLRPKALGVSFIMNDFTTAERIRTSSLATVFSDKQWAKFNEMSPGLAITYFQGLKPRLDFAGTLAASYVSYPLRNDKPTESGDALLLEGDASGNFKMFDESYWLTPYASAGVGVSKYKSYWAAYVPLGLGLKLNLFDEASVFFAGQYRIPVSYETANYHFMYSFGISGVIGK
jgi:OmpA-OmpF porin, OOP family